MSSGDAHHHRIRPSATERARKLRKDAPVPERILWGMLRDRRLGGLKFRRQCAMGPYVVDYDCAEARLVVELDGMSHLGRAAADAKRTAYLKALGLHVMRVTNDELLADGAAVGEWIWRIAQERGSV